MSAVCVKSNLQKIEPACQGARLRLRLPLAFVIELRRPAERDSKRDVQKMRKTEDEEVEQREIDYEYPA